MFHVKHCEPAPLNSSKLGRMAHVFTTFFAALSEEADAAYRLYRERTAAAPVDIIAVSPAPHPADDPFHLWQLRCEAAYERIPRHGDLRLYVIRSLVDGAPDVVKDEAATTAFYLDEENEPGHYPSVLEIGPELTVSSEPAAPLVIAEPVYLADPDTMEDAKRLYAEFRRGAVAADPELTPVDVVHQPEKVGPLWVRSAADQGGGHCEECTSLHMDAWQGFVITVAPEDPTEDTENGIYARLNTTAF